MTDDKLAEILAKAWFHSIGSFRWRQSLKGQAGAWIAAARAVRKALAEELEQDQQPQEERPTPEKTIEERLEAVEEAIRLLRNCVRTGSTRCCPDGDANA